MRTHTVSTDDSALRGFITIMEQTAPIESRIEERMMELLQARGSGKTICPSEVVRSLDSSLSNGWRAEMQTVREVGYRLARAGSVRVLQRGVQVDPSSFPARGPIRIALPEKI